MARLALAVLLGAAAALLIATLAGVCADYLFPPSPTVDLRPELARHSPLAAPLPGIALKILGWGAGALAGARLAFDRGQGDVRLTWAVGAITALAALVIGLPGTAPVLATLLYAAAAGGAAWGAGRLPRPA